MLCLCTNKGFCSIKKPCVQFVFRVLNRKTELDAKLITHLCKKKHFENYIFTGNKKVNVAPTPVLPVALMLPLCT